MTAHELARILLAGPDVPVQIETDSMIGPLERVEQVDDGPVYLHADIP